MATSDAFNNDIQAVWRQLFLQCVAYTVGGCRKCGESDGVFQSISWRAALCGTRSVYSESLVMRFVIHGFDQAMVP